WLRIYGLLDFAGGTVIHIGSGVSALVAAVILGKRHDFDPKAAMAGHNLPFTVLGTGLLWLGWIGFNGGSSLAANGVAALAMTNTNIAAAGACLIWVLMDAIQGKVSITGACSGLVVGLATVTPASGYIQPANGHPHNVIKKAMRKFELNKNNNNNRQQQRINTQTIYISMPFYNDFLFC
ncbi:unnamed protein product, partial [Rotaria sordida]